MTEFEAALRATQQHLDATTKALRYLVLLLDQEGCFPARHILKELRAAAVLVDAAETASDPRTDEIVALREMARAFERADAWERPSHKASDLES